MWESLHTAMSPAAEVLPGSSGHPSEGSGRSPVPESSMTSKVSSARNRAMIVLQWIPMVPVEWWWAGRSNMMWGRDQVACSTGDHPEQLLSVGVVLSHSSFPGLFQVRANELPREETQRLVEEIVGGSAGCCLEKLEAPFPRGNGGSIVPFSRPASPLDDVVDLPPLSRLAHGDPTDDTLGRQSAADLVNLLPGPDSEKIRDLIVIERAAFPAEELQDTFGVGLPSMNVVWLCRVHDVESSTAEYKCQQQKQQKKQLHDGGVSRSCSLSTCDGCRAQDSSWPPVQGILKIRGSTPGGWGSHGRPGGSRTATPDPSFVSPFTFHVSRTVGWVGGTPFSPPLLRFTFHDPGGRGPPPPPPRSRRGRSRSAGRG